MSRHAGGTVFQDGKPRVIEIRDIAVDAEFAPHMIYVRNDDKPGFIGRFGTLLGESGVNVATFALGPRPRRRRRDLLRVRRPAGDRGSAAQDRGDPAGEAGALGDVLDRPTSAGSGAPFGEPDPAENQRQADGVIERERLAEKHAPPAARRKPAPD